ncbi:MAG: hypothetical protein RR140_00165 [Clostridia bacterium]
MEQKQKDNQIILKPNLLINEKNIPVKKQKTKGLTLTAGILDVIMSLPIYAVAIIAFIAGVSQTDPLIILASLGLMILVWVFIALLMLGVAIGYTIVGIKTIGLAGKKEYEYGESKTFLVFSMIIDWVVIGICVGIAFLFKDVLAIIACAVLIVPLTAFVFKLIDIARWNLKVKKGLISGEREKPKFSNEFINFGNPQFQNSLQKKLESIKKMKDDKLISEQEYESLRKIELSKHIK